MSDGLEESLSHSLRAAIAGDQRAYADFLERVAGRLRGTLWRKIGTEAEDIVQETLLAIHLKRDTWDAGQPVLPWVHAIARYKMIDAFRRKGRRVELDIGDFIETLPQPEAETVSDREIGRALGLLGPGQKAVVASISVEGRTISETASVLGMTETAVRVALHRGLAAISRHFARG
ncbi:sigma-70 family RNA polymerase sigma factor [Stagnihabitans tardus]|uniref:Sigma-70 family RNA polymerase sigma factor n=1 Tax=Stagnihabitans tardus TaxID=2699202 RepID=A0AAE4Y738_9RHOB|nr:sigma-70 family RNA polymerase sigma factor [Stagnihabitans tardus]NBZ86349.1 sigma-70 family RNA polymerase sigma factor [Stagnihabitans tardus]